MRVCTLLWLTSFLFYMAASGATLRLALLDETPLLPSGSNISNLSCIVWHQETSEQQGTSAEPAELPIPSITSDHSPAFPSSSPRALLVESEGRTPFGLARTVVKTGAGTFKCIVDHQEVTTFRSRATAMLFAEDVTVTVSRGETATLGVRSHFQTPEDILWYHNDFAEHLHTMVPREEVSGVLAVLTIENAQPQNAGFYVARGVSQDWSEAAIINLFVRDCEAGRWGSNCEKRCPGCLNGGICNTETGKCICAPGFTGSTCHIACAQLGVGPECRIPCSRPLCAGIRVCQDAPYGCSCVSGWTGPRCDKECVDDSFGPNCRLQCRCTPQQHCDRHQGCICPHGHTCSHPGTLRAPSILKVSTLVETNLGQDAYLQCLATGWPLPVHGDIVLMPPGKSPLLFASPSRDRIPGAHLGPRHPVTHMYVNKTLTYINLGHVQSSDAGEWVCRVHTHAGSAHHSFHVDVKVPPIPQQSPEVLETGPGKLKVFPRAEPYFGDGPITSIQLEYRSEEDTFTGWTTMDEEDSRECQVAEGMSGLSVEQPDWRATGQPWVLLNGLQASTNYSLRVILSRPGTGGKGQPGPLSLGHTACLPVPPTPHITNVTIQGRTTVSVNWIPSKHEESLRKPGKAGYRVRVRRGDDNKLVKVSTIPSVLASTWESSDLEHGKDYMLEVVGYSCDIEGSPSEPISFFLNASGPAAPQSVRVVLVSPTSFTVSWEPPARSLSPLSGFLVEWRRWQSSGLTLESPKHAEVHGNSTSMLVQNLSEGVRYRVRVCAHSKTLGEWSSPEFVVMHSRALPPAPVKVIVGNVTTTSIHIRWSLVEGNGITHVVLKHKVYLEKGYAGKVELDVTDGSLSEYVIANLLPNTPFLVEVAARNNMGESSPNLIREVRTLPSKMDDIEGHNPQVLLLAVLASVAATCLFVLFLLFVLVCMRSHTSRSFVFSRGEGSEPVLRFHPTRLSLAGRSRSRHASSQGTAQYQAEPPGPTYPALAWHDISFREVIGQGNFGQVARATITCGGRKFDAAVKMLKDFASEDDHRDFVGELEVLCKIGCHVNIINLIGACEHRGYLYLAIEYARHGNLLEFLRKSRVLDTDPAFAKQNGTACTLSSQQLLHFAADVACGMQYLSEKQFIHRDLAARNILVAEGYVAKIADFGLSRGEEVYVKKTMGRLPVRWMAIESLNYSVYTTKSDVWSFGVLLWEIVSLGGTPYCGMTCAELYEKLPQGYRMDTPHNCDDEVYELMKQCWRDRPHERPTFSQVCLSLRRMLEARKAYVNTALFENFTYAGIDCSAEEA
uniref:angiopoietin-1 receptor-like isoform X2 n=1 Tax=Myxine glutinosa TaxID=7769 RepID=UPI00358E8709